MVHNVKLYWPYLFFLHHNIQFLHLSSGEQVKKVTVLQTTLWPKAGSPSAFSSLSSPALLPPPSELGASGCLPPQRTRLLIGNGAASHLLIESRLGPWGKAVKQAPCGIKSWRLTGHCKSRAANSTAVYPSVLKLREAVCGRACAHSARESHLPKDVLVHGARLHSLTQVVLSDSLMSHSSRGTVLSVMDTSVLFSSILLTTAATALHPSLTLSVCLSTSTELSSFVSARVTPVIFHRGIRYIADPHFSPPSWVSASTFLFPLFLGYICKYYTTT